MTDNLSAILNDFERMKGQLVLTMSWKVEQLVAIGEDEWDYYYVTYDGRVLHWNTCVGSITQLKGKIDDYDRYVRIAKLNFLTLADFAKPIRESHISEMTLEPNKFLTELHWEIL